MNILLFSPDAAYTPPFVQTFTQCRCFFSITTEFALYVQIAVKKTWNYIFIVYDDDLVNDLDNPIHGFWKQLQCYAVPVVWLYKGMESESLLALITHLSEDQQKPAVPTPMLGLEGTQASFYKLDECIYVDLDKRMIFKDNEIIELTRRESEILDYFFKNPNRIIMREELIAHLWAGIASDSNVYINIRNIRKKIEYDNANPQFIMTKPGGGYLFSFGH